MSFLRFHKIFDRLKRLCGYDVVKCFGAGLVSFLMSPPFYLFFFSSICMSLVYYSAIQESKFSRSVKKLFYMYMGYYIGIFYWFMVPFFLDIRYWLLVPFALIGVGFIFALVASFFFVPVLMVRKYVKRCPFYVYVLAACSFFCTEWFRSNVLVGGMPWQNVGLLFSATSGMLKIASGLSQIQLDVLVSLVLFTPLLFSNCRRARLYVFAVPVLLWSAMYILPGRKPIRVDGPTKKAFSIVGMQGNVSSDDVYSSSMSDEARKKIFKVYSSMVEEEKVDKDTIVVLPEGAVGFYYRDFADGIYRRMSSMLNNDGGLIFFPSVVVMRRDVFEESPGSVLYNSVSVVDHKANLIGLNPKLKMVPFGEYVPLRILMPKFVQSIIGLGDISAGRRDDRQHIIHNGIKIATVVCYEIAFDDNFVDKYGNKPNMIISVANDGWIENSLGLYQHIAFVKLRASMYGVPIFHVVNNGPSFVCDKFGNIIKSTKFRTKDILRANLLYEDYNGRYRKDCFFE
ncbi:apolipoprotein N-acyltransferase [Rickettsiales bacterium]|nr:apolipoprotein N-acyltransferase [Rickettsiales bacterium]